ncbi:NAD(P)-dependent oxidoreductase [Spiroplasma chrysopicola]|uniref:Putative NADH-flavin reductase n=1 Tax=Spiroplasma chrysopicola DF-1 TaxID=1276227 RepID=R4U4U7_9MOLU|nr:NAD(P)H-binding protein [Spiroplasma chrysopicola]AGM25583.1 putative NADH-flavin reductase [Spiroplasma chrysopicola DF-1]
MKILLVGAQGRLGKHLMTELTKENITVLVFNGDAKSLTALEEQAIGVEVIVSTVGANSIEEFDLIAQNIITVAKANHQRVVWSGGAASLWTKDNTRLVDTPVNVFPEAMQGWIPAVFGHAKVLELFKNSEIDWSYMSPALDFQDVNPCGNYLAKASDKALYNASGISFASYANGAKALAAEIINPQFIHHRFTIIEEF